MVFFLTAQIGDYTNDLDIRFSSEPEGALAKVTVMETDCDFDIRVETLRGGSGDKVVVLSYGSDYHAKDVSVLGIYDDVISAVKATMESDLVDYVRDDKKDVDEEKVTVNLLNNIFMDHFRFVSVG